MSCAADFGSTRRCRVEKKTIKIINHTKTLHFLGSDSLQVLQRKISRCRVPGARCPGARVPGCPVPGAWCLVPTARRPQRAHRPNRLNRPYRPNRAHRPNRPNRPHRPNRAHRPNRPNRSYKPNRPNKPHRPNRPNRPHRPIENIHNENKKHSDWG